MNKFIIILLCLSLSSSVFAREKYDTPDISTITITGTGNTYTAWTKYSVHAKYNRGVFENACAETESGIDNNAVVYVSRVPLPNTYTAYYGYTALNPNIGFPSRFDFSCDKGGYTTDDFYFNLSSGAKARVNIKLERYLP